MTRYRKKPVVIDAHKWDGDWDGLMAWLDSLGFQDGDDPAMWVDDTDPTLLWIATLEGNMRAPLYVVIIGVQREAYSCDPAIFEATYELATGSTEPSCCAHPRCPGGSLCCCLDESVFIAPTKPADPSFADLIERSSLGTREARAARTTVSDEKARELVERAQRLHNEQEQR